MKRLFSVVAYLLALCILLTSCAQKPKSGIGDQAAALAEKSIEIVDKFLDGDIDAEDAKDQLYDMCKNASGIADFDDADEEILVSVLTIEGYLEYYTSFSDEMILETRNEIAKSAGILPRTE